MKLAIIDKNGNSITLNFKDEVECSKLFAILMNECFKDLAQINVINNNN